MRAVIIGFVILFCVTQVHIKKYHDIVLLHHLQSLSSRADAALDMVNLSQMTCSGNETLTKILQQALPFQVGVAKHSIEMSPWIRTLCPKVAAHFERFPYFTHFIDDVPLMTTLYGAHMVCSLQLAVDMVSSLGGEAYLHAGSHLGALIHGGPIPWDDDVDLFLSFYFKDEFLRLCKNQSVQALPTSSIRIGCVEGRNAIKFFVMTNDSYETPYAWPSPFVDVFLFRENGTHILEVAPDGKRGQEVYQLEHYYPTRPYYFAGLAVPGPRQAVSLRRYSMDRCVVSAYNHRLERKTASARKHIIQCCVMSQALPFVYEGSKISSAMQTLQLPLHLALHNDDCLHIPNIWDIPQWKRDAWATLPALHGQPLTDALPNLDFVEVDNSFAEEGCQFGSKKALVVVELNLERGKHWLQASKLLDDIGADLVLLNEMDLGMARSGQQHTTRLLAASLRMNYAWAIEFVELTRGTISEQAATNGSLNFFGLHGNAILAKCPMYDPVIYRDGVGPYFSDKASSINANGFEKRLGGRMALLTRIPLDGRAPIVVGATHKLDNFGDEIRQYIGLSPAIIGGDQDWAFCERVGLRHVDNQSHATWPASCTSTGKNRGDILCSNMDVLVPEQTTAPCLQTSTGISILIGDHAITSVTLRLQAAADSEEYFQNKSN